MDSVINYEIINYINDVSLENAEVLMTSNMKGNYTSAYTYGLDRISVDNLKVVNNIKTDPLYYLYDGRGSVTELVNRNGEVTSNYNYEAFGLTDHLGYLGNIGIHYENYYGYNGENYNERSGLQYLRARYYEPDTGTFLTRDSYLGNIMNPLSQNRYSYAENNPIMNVDPSGHFAKGLWSGAKKIGSAIGKGISNLATKVVEVIEKLPSTVKQVFTGTGSQVKKNSNTSKATTSSKTYSYTETQAFNTTELLFNLVGTGMVVGASALPQTSLKGNTNKGLDIDDDNPVSKQNSTIKALKSGTLKFKGDEANIHFKTHGKEMMNVLAKSEYSVKDYINDANYVVQNGKYVPELNGFIQPLGGIGSAKYSFVGLDRSTGNITTLHIKTVSELAKKAPSLGLIK